MDQETLAKIQRSKDEIEPRLNFLRDDKYLNPETPIMKKPGRQNFFQDFYVEEIIYHIVGKWDKPELKCYMLIPKNLDVGQSILFHVLWHGGGLTTGGGNYVHWWCDYKLDLAIKANAIMLIPMYRLMPEDRGAEIHQDLDSWWSFYQNDRCLEWVQKCLLKHALEAKPENLDRAGLLISGESAGGLLAVYSWLNQSSLVIKALYLQYPMLKHYEKKVSSNNRVRYMDTEISLDEIKKRATELVELTDDQRRDGRVVSRSDCKPPFGMLAAVMLSNTCKWKEVYQDGNEDVKDAPSLLESRVEEKLLPYSFPKVFFVHGTADEVIPIKNTEEFVKRLNEVLKLWKCNKVVEFLKLEDVGHGFDYEIKGHPCQKQIEEMMESLVDAWKGG